MLYRNLLILILGSAFFGYELPASANCDQNFASLKTPSIHSLRERYAFFRDIGEQDNKNFRSLAERANRGEKTEAKLFLDLENAIMKDLNDKIVNDKDVVTALVNFHKKVFWQAIQEDPLLKQAIVAKYSDPKSIRLAFNSDSPELLQHLEAAYQKAGENYETQILKLPDSRLWFKNTRGLAASAFNWHLSGHGSTPDLAGVAARDARTATADGGRASLRGFRDAESNLIEKADRADALRKKIAQRWESVAKVLTKSETGKSVLSYEAINTIRKATPKLGEDYIGAIRADFLAHFKVRLTDQEILDFREYLHCSDAFSPGIYIDKRVEIELGKARHGIVSVDLKAQNARNIEATMKALADTESTAVANRLLAVRSAEAKVTEGLDANKRTISKMGESRGGISQFTGDDGVYFPDHELSQEEKRTIARQMSKRVGLSRTRLVFLSPHYFDTGLEIPAEKRSEWIVAAEDSEKKLQKALVKSFGPKANDLAIALDVRASQHARALGVYISLPNGQMPSAVLIAETKRILSELGWRVRTIQVP